MYHDCSVQLQEMVHCRESLFVCCIDDEADSETFTLKGQVHSLAQELNQVLTRICERETCSTRKYLEIFEGREKDTKLLKVSESNIPSMNRIFGSFERSYLV